jgi:hypothetical protein
MTEYADVTRVTASTTVSSDPAVLVGLLIATDGSNSPTVTAYNDTDAATAANKITPPVVVDSSSQEFVGFFPAMPIRCRSALHVAVSTLGSGEVMVFWRTM